MLHNIAHSEADLPREERLFVREVQQFPPRKARWQSFAGSVRMLFEFAVVAGFCGFVIKLATVLPS